VATPPSSAVAATMTASVADHVRLSAAKTSAATIHSAPLMRIRRSGARIVSRRSFSVGARSSTSHARVARICRKPHAVPTRQAATT